MRKAQKNSDNMTFREQLKERYKQQGFLAEYYKEYPDSFWDNLERFSEGHYFIEDEIKAIPDDSIWDKDGSHTPTMGIIEYIKKVESGVGMLLHSFASNKHTTISRYFGEIINYP